MASNWPVVVPFPYHSWVPIYTHCTVTSTGFSASIDLILLLLVVRDRERDTSIGCCGQHLITYHNYSNCMQFTSGPQEEPSAASLVFSHCLITASSSSLPQFVRAVSTQRLPMLFLVCSGEYYYKISWYHTHNFIHFNFIRTLLLCTISETALSIDTHWLTVSEWRRWGVNSHVTLEWLILLVPSIHHTQNKNTTWHLFLLSRYCQRRQVTEIMLNYIIISITRSQHSCLYIYI